MEIYMIKNLEYLVSPNFCGMQEVSLLASEFERTFNELDDLKAGKTIVQLNSEQIENSEVLDAVYNGNIIAIIKKKLFLIELITFLIIFFKRFVLLFFVKHVVTNC